MELPTAQEKSKQIFFAILDVHQYTFRDKMTVCHLHCTESEEDNCTHKWGIAPAEHEFI
jgi:hypothetical protein